MVCRDVGVESGAAEEVACYLGLLCEMVPKLEWKIDVGGAESADEVVLECLDGSLCSVHAMIVGFDELDCTVAGGNEFFDGGCGLIVCDIEGGSKTFFREDVEDGAEGGNDVFTLC